VSSRNRRVISTAAGLIPSSVRRRFARLTSRAQAGTTTRGRPAATGLDRAGSIQPGGDPADSGRSTGRPAQPGEDQVAFAYPVTP
jgi:hypothetical protein